MRQHFVSLLAVFSFGCAAAPVVKLHVDPALMSRLAPAVVQPLDDRAHASEAEIDNDLAHARERVTHAQAALRQANEEPQIAETAEVRAAKIARAKHDLAWQNVLVEVAQWRGLVATAAAELAKAQLLSRTGQDIDIDAFVDQHAQLHGHLTAAQRRATIERARFEESDQRFGATKLRYAQSHLSAAR